jgi:hypothetical protein
MQFSVEYSNSANLDPPVISTVDAGIQGTTVGFTVTTPNLNVTRGVVLFLPKSGNPAGDAWTHLELTNNGSGRWTGAATVAAGLANQPIGQYFVQLLDNAGNVATSSNKAANFVAPVLPISAGIHILANNAAPTATAYTAPVSVRLTNDSGGSGAGTFQIAIDGATPTIFTAPITLTADGVHTVDAIGADGSHTQAFITISTHAPTVTVTTPGNGNQYPLGTTITAAFNCASLVPLATNGCVQTSPAPGSPLANTVGLHSFTVRATDSLGRVTIQTVTYTVVTINPALSATVVVSSPATVTFGSPLTFTATVSPSVPAGGPSPSGTVSFFVDGQPRALDTVTLVAGVTKPKNGVAIGTASMSTAGLAAGSHTVTASYSGDANFAPSTSTGAASVVTCTATISGPHSGATVIGAGVTCLLGAQVTGSVTVSKGALVDLENSSIAGSLTASGAAALRLCGSTVDGTVSITGAKGFVLVGDAGEGCGPNNLGSALILTNNTKGVQAIGNRVSGAVTSSGNAGSGPFPLDLAPVVAGNHP